MKTPRTHFLTVHKELEHATLAVLTTAKSQTKAVRSTVALLNALGAMARAMEASHNETMSAIHAFEKRLTRLSRRRP